MKILILNKVISISSLLMAMVLIIFSMAQFMGFIFGDTSLRFHEILFLLLFSIILIKIWMLDLRHVVILIYSMQSTVIYLKSDHLVSLQLILLAHFILILVKLSFLSKGQTPTTSL